MSEYDSDFPPSLGWANSIRAQGERLLLDWFRWRMRRLKLGSPKWHSWQEKLSRGSAVGLEVRRRNIFYESTLQSGCLGIHVLPGVALYYPRNIRFGKNVFLNRGAYIVAPEQVEFGDNVLVGPYVVINSGNHNYADSGRLIREQGHRLAPIFIEDDVWLGAHAVVMPGVRLGRGCIVGAGAVVTKSIEPGHVVVGVPASRVISRRTAEFAD